MKLAPVETTAKGIFIVRNDRGLHTRPSTEIVKCAASFSSDVRLTYQKTEINAKSLLGILMLAAEKGSRIKVIAKGKDADKAVASLLALASNNFNIRY
ncbi:MAG: HPr family phosphocarrier protein [Parachlamydiaceae bacterium]|nr:HPr family phosphocarrier protein [Parachlamydiaceae bacterium]